MGGCLSPENQSHNLSRQLPILNDDSGDARELFQTAVAYVKCEGDIAKTAGLAYCHKNTVRYRMNKLRERLGPASSEAAFLEQLPAAVKIHLLNDL